MSHYATSAVLLLVSSAAYAEVVPEEVRAPDVDAIGLLATARHRELVLDGAYEHADGSDAIALVPGARIAAGELWFLEGALPLGYGLHAHALALGNVTVTGGVLPSDQRLVAIALRISAATSPALGNGMTTVAALAAPRIADPELFLPHTTSAEIVADWRWRGDHSWVQAEAGIAGWWQPATPFETVLRASIAGGVHVERRLDLTASFVTRSFVFVSGAPEGFVHTLILGLVTHIARGEISFRLEVPVDDSARAHDRFVAGFELRGR